MYLSIGGSFEGVDSNQWLLLQCKLCMNTNDVYFVKSGIFMVLMYNGLCAHIHH